MFIICYYMDRAHRQVLVCIGDSVFMNVCTNAHKEMHIRAHIYPYLQTYV